MQTRVQQWGNSIALRIPKSFAKEANIVADSPVELTYSDGRFIVTPIRRRATLSELLSDVSDQNKHEAFDFGVVTGQEEW